MNNAPVYRLAAILALVGVVIFLLKWLAVGLPLSAGKMSNAWQIETDVSFRANGGPIRASVFLPPDAPGMHIHDIRLIGSGFGTLILDRETNRVASFTRRQASGEQSIHVRFVVQLYPKHQERIRPRQAPPLLPGARPADISHPNLTATEGAAANALLQTARAQSADDLSMVRLLLKMVASKPPADRAQQLVGKAPSQSLIAEKSVAALRAGGFNARIVHGVDVAKSRRTAPIVNWIEVKLGEDWQSFAITDRPGRFPDANVAWWRGSEPLVSVNGGQPPTRRISVRRLRESELSQVLIRGHADQSPFVVFSLYSLPTSTQDLYRILFMIPVGVFVLVILRNLVGIKGLGTFMPVLIALAFRESTLLIGVVFFVSIIAIGLLCHLYFDQLKLLVAPRLAVILIVVILSMALISVVTHRLGFDRGLAIALFPIVILTMTIERVSIIWDERGPPAAIWEAIQSLLIASVCYFIMTIASLQYFVFTFPEINLILLAAILVIGRYSGYRLLELFRFRNIAEAGK